MILLIENAEKYDIPNYVTSRMTCLWKNREKARGSDEEYFERYAISSCVEVYCDLGEYDDIYSYIVYDPEDFNKPVHIMFEVIPEKDAIIADIEYIKSGNNIEHELAHYKVGEVFSNYFYLGKTKEEGKLYARQI